jgi:undecaprenyl diphosphate synthase
MPDSPQHVAIIMDGNGRWARSRGLPRVAGHRASVKVVRKEVGLLMGLFLDALVREVADLHKNAVRLRFIGDRTSLSTELLTRMLDAEALTRDNAGLTLIVAVAYGGRWDIAQACRSLAGEVLAGTLAVRDIDETRVAEHLALAGVPDPDLLIRTGGDQRISNFLLWNLAYTELCFPEVLWPEFSPQHLNNAFAQYAQRERRYGMTSAQVASKVDA